MLFADFTVPRVENIFKKNAIIQLYKDNIIKKFETYQSKRYQDNIKIPKFNTKLMQNNYIYLGIKYFNNLPIEIKKKPKTSIN